MADDTAKLIAIVEANTKQFENALRRIEKTVEKTFKGGAASAAKLDRGIASTAAATDRLNRSMTRARASISSFTTSLGAPLSLVGVALAIKQVTAYADAWTAAGNKIAAASEISGRQARTLEEINKIATDTRTGLTPTVDLYAKLLRATKDVASSELEVARATEIVNKAFKAGGAATSEQIAGILQLSQGLASGILQGDELRSLRENAPLLAQAIANEFETTIGGLKDLGAAGELTAARIFKAILKGGPEIEKAFGRTESTIGEAMTLVGNAMIEATGDLDNLTGSSQKLVNALKSVEDAVRGIGGAAVWTLDKVDQLKEILISLGLIDVEARQQLTTAVQSFASQERARLQQLFNDSKKEAGLLADKMSAINFDIDAMQQKIASGQGGVIGALHAAQDEAERLRLEFNKTNKEVQALRAQMNLLSGIQYDPLSSLLVPSGLMTREQQDANSLSQRYGAPAVGPSTGIAPIVTARQFEGLDEDRDADILSNLFKQAGQNVDPRMVAWCAAFVNAALATNGLPGTGSNMARSFLDYGTETDTPKVGDIVVLKRGNSETQGHVGFYEGMDAQGNVRVLGGNQSDGVNVKSFNPSEVLGYRQIPGAGEASASGNPIEEEIARRSEATKTALEDQRQAQEELTKAKADFKAMLKEEGEAIELEISGIKKSTAEQEFAAKKQELTNELIAAGIPITKEYAKAIEDIAHASAAAVTAGEAHDAQIQADEDARQAAIDRSDEIEQLAIDRADAIRDLSSDVIGGLASDLANGVKPAEALANALQKVAEKLLDIGINALTSSLFGPQGTSLGGIFGSLFGSGGASSAALPLTGLATGLAQGGIMTSHGPVPLKRYGSGGIAHGPQMALFGEGRTPEAFVPLPDGRSIPVRLKVPGIIGGGRGGGQQRVFVENVVRLEPSPEFIGTVDSRARQTEERTLARTPSYLADQKRRAPLRG